MSKASFLLAIDKLCQVALTRMSWVEVKIEERNSRL